MKIGVTGHQQRDGIDWLWVRARIKRYLVGKTSIVGYSSLAAGADQVFADAILEVGGKLIAVLPIDNYETFFSEEALDNYNRLRLLSETIELNSQKSENIAFLDAGKWISRQSTNIIAIWDGEPAENAGGTGDIVAYALSLGKSVHRIDPIRRVVTDL